MRVTFKTLAQQQFQLELAEDISFADVKKKIAEERGAEEFAANHQKLIYGGRILKDDEKLGVIAYDEAKFIVVVAGKKKTENLTFPTNNDTPITTNAHDSTSSTAPPSVNDSASTAAPAPSTGVAQGHSEEIKVLTDMGYPQEEAVRALRAAFYNVDRAVEYLVNGIPNGVAIEGAGQEGVARHNANGGSLDFLRNDEQFIALRDLARYNPQLLPQLLAEFGRANPQVMAAIRNNQTEFTRLLNEGGPQAGGAAGGQELGDVVGHAQIAGGAAGGGPQVVTIDISEEDHEAIDRLKAMGFPEQLVIEAYITCDKNESLAVNYILSRIDEHRQQQTGTGGHGSSS